MELVKKFIYEKIAKKELSHEDAKKMLRELQEKNVTQGGPIAIIGINGCFSKAKQLDEFWSNLRHGENCIGDFSMERIKDSISHLYKNPFYCEFVEGGPVFEQDFFNKNSYAKGSYLDEIDKFDADFFDIPPREAVYMDPYQRFFLEIAWGALEDAGYTRKRINGTKTGIYLGKENTNYSFYKNISKDDPMQLTGSWESITVSRLSYLMNLKGPCMIIDAACSSGLISVHMACKAIKSGEYDMALAGGICLNILAPENLYKGGNDLSSVESLDNMVRTFDKDANGTVWGEGVGVILLKSLKEAIQDKDNIHAVILGSAINNDGASSGIIAPDAEAQEELLIAAWKDAHINPETIGYIEAHGTGTVLGDPIEFKGLTTAFRRYTNKKQFCGIGSLKTNLGHLVAASGLASLLKVVLALKHKEIPPSINFNKPNPYIDFVDSPLYITDSLKAWESNGIPRRAGISSFGFSGTNSHVIVEEYVKPEEKKDEKGKKEYCLTISAKKEHIIKEFCIRYVNFLEKNHDISLDNLCYTAHIGKDHYSHRLAIIFNNTADLKDKLIKIIEADLQNFNESDIYYAAHKVVSIQTHTKEPGYITELEKNKFNELASGLIHDYVTEEKNRETLLKMCELYVRGADIEWKKLYEGENRYIISLPTYPFERVRYWTEPKVSRIKGWQFEREIDHPLLHYCLVKSLDTTIYLTEFNSKRQWVLSDHKILDKCVVPGTTYVEMARAAASLEMEGACLELRDIYFITPLLVEDDETIPVHTIIKKVNDHFEFLIASKYEQEEDLQWIKHAEGKMAFIEKPQRMICSIEKIKSAQKKHREIENQESIYGVFEFGHRWENIVNAHHGTNEALIELRLKDDIASDLNTFLLHPGMLDNAVNFLSQNNENETYLPFTYKSLKYYQPMPQRLFSHIIKKQDKASHRETIPFDITLMDENGSPIAEIKDYLIKKVQNVTSALSSATHDTHEWFEIIWKDQEYAESEQKTNGGALLYFKGRGALANELGSHINQNQITIIEVEEGSSFKRISDHQYVIGSDAGDYEKLCEGLKGTQFTKIIHTFSLSGKKVTNVKDLMRAENRGVYSLYFLVRALVKHKIKVNEGLVIIADYAHEVSHDESLIKPHNASLFGLAKVVGQEYEHYTCKCIDIDTTTSTVTIVREIYAQDKKNIVALRNNTRYIQELQPLTQEDTNDTCRIREHGIYLILGGTGGLGLAMAEYFTSQNKVTLCLVNRTQMPQKEEWEGILKENSDEKLCDKIKMIKKVEETGSHVICYSADVSDENQMRDVISSIHNDYGTIHGIIHCAGNAGNGFIINREEEVFKNVIKPKTLGVFLLDELTKEYNLDFFILFSTITSLTGDPGQGDYTAAGCYMDAFSAYRNKKGKKTTTINWPIWSETGMALDFGATDEYTIFKSLTTRKAIEAFQYAINSSKSRLIPGRINYTVLAKRKNALSFSLSNQIIRTLLREEKKLKKDNAGNERKIVEVTITGKPQEQLNDIEHTLIQIWAQVLGIDKIDVYDDFHTLGGDSILTTDLLKAINNEYLDIMDISDIYYYSNIIAMSEYISDVLRERTN